MNWRTLLPFLLLTVSIAHAQTTSEALRIALKEQGNPEFADCDVRLLPSGKEKFEDMFAAIENAQRFVHLEYFVFRTDSIGMALLQLLEKKAKEGVEVRVLIDAYGNYKSPYPLSEGQLNLIRQSGVKIALFDPLRFPWLPNMYHRDHRKIVVVDGECVYTGGMNVADYYLHGTERTGKWRDMQVCLSGSVVDEYHRVFAKIWERTTGESLDLTQYKALPKTEADDSADQPTDAEKATVCVVNREPGKLSRQMRRAIVAALDMAQHEVRIVNPYPTSTRSVTHAMSRAMKRGVRLQLMVSANMDNRITPEVVAIQMKKMMRRGAEIYYFEGGFHHTKVMTIDRECCNIGTANLDGRSLRYDYEINAFIFSPATTNQLNAIFDSDLQQSQILTPQNFKKRFSLKQRITGRFFRTIKCLL